MNSYFIQHTFFGKFLLKYLSERTLRFILRLLLIFVAYKIFFFIVWRVPLFTQWHEMFTVSVIQAILYPVKWLLHLLTDNAVYFYEQARIIRIENSGGVKVSPPCSGTDIMFFYLSIILAFPQRLQHKITYAAAGIVTIHILNILHITSLALLSYFAPDWVEINHKFIFTLIVYSAILYIWGRYVKSG